MRARHFFLVAALSFTAVSASACSLKMALEPWPPYIYSDDAGQLAGVDLELVQAIVKEAGCTLRIEAELPALRRQILFREGKLDLMLAASDTPERRRYARFSMPYRNESVGLFTTPAKLARFRKLASFGAIAQQHVSLLAPKAGWYGDSYHLAGETLEANGNRSTFGSFQQGVQMFKAGRADLIMGDRMAVLHEARRQGVALAALPYVPFRAPVHLMLNAASTTQANLDSLNAAIQRLERSGALPAIRARHGLP